VLVEDRLLDTEELVPVDDVLLAVEPVSVDDVLLDTEELVPVDDVLLAVEPVSVDDVLDVDPVALLDPNTLEEVDVVAA